jgi:hypothetical protein
MLPFRSGRSLRAGASGAFITLAILCSVAFAADPKPSPKGGDAKPRGGRKAKAEATAKSGGMLSGVPLPIGQEAKGLVLPDYDTEGRLRAKFEAATAKRIDAERIQFTGLKMVTYTPESTPDLEIDMPDSTLDLNTRVITSNQRTTVARADFNITGDTMKFDTIERKGTLVGNVKMVITDSSNLTGKNDE